jgi:hypothetical protein
VDDFFLDERPDHSVANVAALLALILVLALANALGERRRRAVITGIVRWPQRGVAANELGAVIQGDAKKLVFVVVVAGTCVGGRVASFNNPSTPLAA